MALVVYDRVQETTATTGTGPLTLAGAIAGFQSFAVIGNGNTTFYCIVNGNAWEVGVGTYSTTGPTLARTTILSNSLGTTAALNLVGSSNVFVTYPAGKSVNLDATGNVGPLGTITSGVWNGTTIPVAYGGTGVTTSSGANSVVLRDSNQNIAVNRVNQSNTNTTAAGGTTALTAASSYIHTLVGTGGQTYTLPDATTLATGVAFLFNNLATGTLTIQDYAAASIGTIPSGGAGAVFLTNNATVGGTWDLHAYLPEGVTFGTNAFNLGTAIVSGGTWQGGTVAPAYGGTGLTTFVGANNALFSTGASTLTAGTLPILAGGTGATTNTGARTNLGATTLGSNLFTITNPSAVTFPRFNADNTVSALNATDFRTAIGAGTGGGSVTSVGGTGTVNGLTLTGTVTTTGNLTLGGTLSGTASGLTVGAATNASNLTGGTISGNYTVNNATSPNSFYLQFGDNTGWTYRFMTSVSGTPTTRFSFVDNGNFTAVGSVTASNHIGAGTGLTGTASSLSIGGNAATATSLTSSNFISQTGSQGSWNADFQNTPAGTARYSGDVGANGVNGPGGSWWIQQNFRHTNATNFWGTQVAWGWEDNANRLATRNVTNGTFGGWVYYLNSNNFTTYAPSLTGSGASGTWNINVTGSAGSVPWSGISSRPSNIMFYEGFTLNADTMTTNSTGFTYSVNAPWTGPIARFSANTGYDLQINAGYNNTNISYRVRNGDAGVWQGWNSFITSANIGGQTVGNTTSISSAVGGGYTWTGLNYFLSNRNTTADSAPLQAFSNNGSGAIMSFHRGGFFATNFGLDSDNVMRIGGWSAGANRWQLDMSGNETIPGRLTANAWSTVGRNYSNEWIEFPNVSGLYSPINGAHFYPNNGSYGSWQILGSRNGWGGIEFPSATTSLMMNYDNYGFHRNDSGWRFYNAGGNGYFPGEVQAGWSDKRLKENFRPMTAEALDIINKLQTYRFNWNAKVAEMKLPIEVGKEEVGCVAQEVQAIFPDAVAINKSANIAHPDGTETQTDYLTINYSKLTPLLIQSVNELTKQINELRAEIAVLKEQK